MGSGVAYVPTLVLPSLAQTWVRGRRRGDRREGRARARAVGARRRSLIGRMVRCDWVVAVKKQGLVPVT